MLQEAFKEAGFLMPVPRCFDGKAIFVLTEQFVPPLYFVLKEQYLPLSCFGLTEQFVFPEVNLEKSDKARGMNITFVTSAGEDGLARGLLERLGMPFKKPAADHWKTAADQPPSPAAPSPSAAGQ